MAQRLTRNAFTTVANWRSYGALHHDGMFLGQKAHSLRPLIALPSKTTSRFALALSIHRREPDRSALHLNGWSLIDPRRAAGTPSAYRRFVGGSRAEFGIAKSGYVVSRSGWFSDRSACYLASGRPVLAHDTGFGKALPTGEGLLAFATEDDVLAGIDAIETDYPRHRETARAIAETHFDSDRVLARLLEAVGGAS
jgi:glycosyltransferase involved in cell wall biosynthesis